MSVSELRGAALVTGAGRGIGAAYAERLARRGRDLILVADDGAALEGLARRLRGVRIELVVADLECPNDLAAVETQLRGDDRIAVLVNDANAGDAPRLARAAAEGFTAQGHGTILNVLQGGHARTLAALLEFSRALHDELRPRGVHVKARLHRPPISPPASSPARAFTWT